MRRTRPSYWLCLLLAVPLLLASPAWAEGWVLIAPKLDSSGKHLTFRFSDPVSQWEQLYAFDSASMCEEVKARMVDAAKKKAKDIYDLDLVSASASRCMPYELWWKAQQPAR